MPSSQPATPTAAPTELDYQLLQALDHEPAASQRSLAVRLGVSVGKVNFCLRALVDKGWVKAQNFRRSDNKWAYAYLLTPHGVGARVQLTRDFLARKEREYEALARQIHALKDELAREPQHLSSHGNSAQSLAPSTQPGHPCAPPASTRTR